MTLDDFVILKKMLEMLHLSDAHHYQDPYL